MGLAKKKLVTTTSRRGAKRNLHQVRADWMEKPERGDARPKAERKREKSQGKHFSTVP